MRRFTVVLAVVVVVDGLRVDNSTDTVEDSTGQEDLTICAFKFTPTCLRSLATHIVDKIASDPHFQLLPGMKVSSDVSSGDQGTTHRAAALVRSLTISVQPLNLELPYFNTSQILENLLTQVTGRKKGGNAGGLGAIALMMGGAVMTMMMAGLAAMAGKALMTSLTALMLAGMGALKGNGGGGGTKTVEIVAKPQHGHSSDHGW